MADPFSPSRLTVARKRRGLTKADLCASSGVNVRLLSNYESGRHSPRPENVERLAIALRFQPSFFSRPPIRIAEPRALTFRALTSMTAAQRDAVSSVPALAKEFDDALRAKFKLPESDIPTQLGSSPAEAADLVRREWGLAEHPIGNMIAHLEARGARVVALPPVGREVDGVSTWIDGVPFVALETADHAPERIRWSAAHELGHLVLHSHNDELARKDEVDADQFAANLLMPAEPFLESLPAHINLESALDLKRVWGVPALAAIRRANDLKRIARWQYEMLMVEAVTRGWRRNEPEPTTSMLSVVFAKITAALRSESSSLYDVAESIGWNRGDVDELLHGLHPRLVGAGGVGADVQRCDAQKPVALKIVYDDRDA